uniref:protein FAR1-RELATED SEQUENCE 11-like n=1 Tax=Erigeron canadensis TaxID=72917 RepID=UPI001CB8DDE3|nr:protein FAR1-RELATED SEQUENCE 11-like [Erigeron canadensis]
MFDLNNLPDEEYDEDIINETLNNEPFIGQTFNTFQEAYLFYENYAKQHGFTVRKDRSHKRNDTTVIRDICCHREGKKRLKLVDLSKNQRNRGSIKCGCNAHMCVTLKRSYDIFPEEWHVTTFVKDHNHELLSPEEMRFLPANRIITPEDEQQILLYKEAGLNVRQIINVMELQKQVKHGDLSFQEKDVHNLFARVRRALGDNDAMDLMNYMKASKEKNNKFQYDYTVDEDMRLENIFWCQPQSFDWYEKFVDVIVFDTTYKVNAYDMPCALFVGINNHGKTVLFASVLLRNETVKTFTWLMKTFVSIMKKPSKTIITDQDPWMTEAIATEMPTTKHSFCIWHITSKFSSWFAALFRTEYQNWCGDFYTLYKMTSIEEFEHSWPLVVAKYNLQKNNHVQGLYKIRKSWAPAYLRNYFFGGMKSTSRLESINAFIKRFVFSRTSLREFVKQVDLAVEEIGIREVKDKMSSTLALVSLKTKSPLEAQAYGILTPFAFSKFQVEFERANQYLIVHVEGNDFIVRYFDSGNHKNHKQKKMSTTTEEDKRIATIADGIYTFVSIMKKPSKTIITDQDPWMTEAIATEMPTTKQAFVYGISLPNLVVGLQLFFAPSTKLVWLISRLRIGIREVKDKMSSTLALVSLKTKSPLEAQAYGILTPFAFSKFQVEFERANQYLIFKNFEFWEILCRHIFRALLHKDVLDTADILSFALESRFFSSGSAMHR